MVEALYVVLLAAGYRTLGRGGCCRHARPIGLVSIRCYASKAASLWGWLLAYYGIPQAASLVRQDGLRGSQYRSVRDRRAGVS